ncbi:MAG: hypothetical protein VX206_02885 [Pseudomonadota bacterium]|nr:hypothetical protein [Pseudomonadota bacterium]
MPRIISQSSGDGDRNIASVTGVKFGTVPEILSPAGAFCDCPCGSRSCALSSGSRAVLAVTRLAINVSIEVAAVVLSSTPLALTPLAPSRYATMST